MVTFLSALILAGSTQSYGIDKTRYRELFQKLGEAAKQKNWQVARDVLTEIGRELPAPTPRYLLSVATIEARLGHKDEALRWIQKYVATGLSFDPSRDDDLKALMAARNRDEDCRADEGTQPSRYKCRVCLRTAASGHDAGGHHLSKKFKTRNQRAAFTSPASSTTRSIESRFPRPAAGNARWKN